MIVIYSSERNKTPPHPLTNDTFTNDPKSRHEIAFVFGQLLSIHSVPSLLQVLQNSQESDMVRHEAAEALGGIATPDVLPHLKEWMTREDAPRIVRESCQVAIDMWEVRTEVFFHRLGWLIDHCLTSTRTRTNFNMPMGSMRFGLRSPLQCDSIVDPNWLVYDNVYISIGL